jgi:hypothetical protein
MQTHALERRYYQARKRMTFYLNKIASNLIYEPYHEKENFLVPYCGKAPYDFSLEAGCSLPVDEAALLLCGLDAYDDDHDELQQEQAYYALFYERLNHYTFHNAL